VEPRPGEPVEAGRDVGDDRACFGAHGARLRA
jgi:hypothetical protein